MYVHVLCSVNMWLFDLVVVMKCWGERSLGSFWCFNLKLKIIFLGEVV